jgi:hypothetical protein
VKGRPNFNVSSIIEVAGSRGSEGRATVLFDLILPESKSLASSCIYMKDLSRMTQVATVNVPVHPAYRKILSFADLDGSSEDFHSCPHIYYTSTRLSRAFISMMQKFVKNQKIK